MLAAFCDVMLAAKYLLNVSVKYPTYISPWDVRIFEKEKDKERKSEGEMKEGKYLFGVRVERVREGE